MPVSISGTNGITFPDNSIQTAAASPFGLKNRLINGDMVVDQRNNGASITGNNGAYGVDRWVLYATQSSKLTCQRNQNSVTPPAGFTNYLGYTSSSAYTVGSSDYFSLTQPIEGFNVADLAWGTANARTVTLSFWVRSSLTGTFGGALRNSDVTRTYPFSYTISSANTWEYKTITIPGDTSGTWNTTNGYGLAININLGAGATVSGPAGVWANTFYCNASSTVNLVGTNGATFYITGVQLERNTTATPFEWIPYTTELQLCQRYLPALNGIYWTSTGYAYAANTGIGFITFPVTARTAPTGITYSSLSHFTVANSTNTSYTPTNIIIDVGNPAGTSIIWTTSTGLTSGTPTRMYASNASAQILFTGCEL